MRGSLTESKLLLTSTKTIKDYERRFSRARMPLPATNTLWETRFVDSVGAFA
jgi:hypothetical protein